MKHIKTYENINEPQIGDWVICSDKNINNKKLNNFLNDNIGKIIKDNQHIKYKYLIEYVIPDNFLFDIHAYFSGGIYEKKIQRGFSDENILAHSKNKKDLQIIVNTNKYNL